MSQPAKPPCSRKWHHHSPTYYGQNLGVFTDCSLCPRSSQPFSFSQLRPQALCSRDKPFLFSPTKTHKIHEPNTMDVIPQYSIREWWMTRTHSILSFFTEVHPVLHHYFHVSILLFLFNAYSIFYNLVFFISFQTLFYYLTFRPLHIHFIL